MDHPCTQINVHAVNVVSETPATRVVHVNYAPYDIYIGRPGKWGNPFSAKSGTLARYRVRNRREALARYQEWLLSQPDLVEQARRELRGKTLGCWCRHPNRPRPCHGDILAAVAEGRLNPPEEGEGSVKNVQGSLFSDFE